MTGRFTDMVLHHISEPSSISGQSTMNHSRSLQILRDTYLSRLDSKDITIEQIQALSVERAVEVVMEIAIKKKINLSQLAKCQYIAERETMLGK